MKALTGLTRKGLFETIILVFVITPATSSVEPKIAKMRILQENKQECLVSAKTFRFTLLIPLVTLSTETRCEPKLENEEPEVKGVDT